MDNSVGTPMTYDELVAEIAKYKQAFDQAGELVEKKKIPALKTTDDIDRWSILVGKLEHFNQAHAQFQPILAKKIAEIEGVGKLWGRTTMLLLDEQKKTDKLETSLKNFKKDIKDLHEICDHAEDECRKVKKENEELKEANKGMTAIVRDEISYRSQIQHELQEKEDKITEIEDNYLELIIQKNNKIADLVLKLEKAEKENSTFAEILNDMVLEEDLLQSRIKELEENNKGLKEYLHDIGNAMGGVEDDMYIKKAKGIQAKLSRVERLLDRDRLYKTIVRWLGIVKIERAFVYCLIDMILRNKTTNAILDESEKGKDNKNE